MLNYSSHQFQTASRLKGIKEIAGPQDNPTIELAHILTNIAAANFQDTNTDEIPWCSSGMNLNILITNFERNAKATYKMIRDRGFTEEIAKKVFALTQLNSENFSNLILVDSGLKVPAPTWSAAASSWCSWGQSIAQKDMIKGDIVVLVRKGGNHVSLFEAENTLTFTLLGYNQSDELKSSDTYLKARAISFRRFLG